MAILAAFTLSLTLSACPVSNAVDCDPLLCPTGSVCVPGGCASPREADACAGLPEHAACSYDGLAQGLCTGGACRAVVCGDGLVAGPEVCDDANTTSGDGCAAHCDSTEACGNGIADFAVGEACDDGNRDDDDTCRNNCTIPGCGDGVVDTQNGEACDEGAANANTSDAACRVNCQPRRCGDSIRDTGETCDDGNLISGDGCSGDCLSNETCGNGYVDIAKGEACDDNSPRGLSQDGCSSRCSPEFLTWLDRTQTLTGRDATALAYDAARATLVLFGGYGNTGRLNDTWEFDGTTWTLRSPTIAPAPRYEHALAYDAARAKIVLFGGYGNTGRLNDTWEFDGTTWSQRSPATAPAARDGHALAYDAARAKIVLFGGHDSERYLKRHLGIRWHHLDRPHNRASTCPALLSCGCL